MYAELVGQMKTAASSRVEHFGLVTTEVFWGFSVAEILKVVLDKAVELGREYRGEIENAAKAAIDAVVELDLPYIPDGVEDTIDSATRAAGYAAVVAVLDAILGPAM